MKSLIFKEYIWLLNTISRAERITFKELQEAWLRTSISGGKELSRSTFNRHKEDVQNIFGIDIVCDKRTNKYSISNSKLLKEQTVQNWMISTLTVSNIISDSLSLQDRILLESVPSSGDFLTKVLEAMKQKVSVCVEYCKYGDTESKRRVVDPYCVKLSNQRWYMLSHMRKEDDSSKGKDLYFLYSFDRIRSLELTEEHFEMDDEFSFDAFFSEYYGVMTVDNVPLQTIVLRAYGKERYYLKDLPLHVSQKLLEESDTENYTDFELRLRPTIDFVHALLSKGAGVKVLSPQSLVDQVREEHQKAFEMY